MKLTPSCTNWRNLVRRKDAEVVPLVHASLRTLQNALREAVAKGQPFHILHVIGHGALDPNTGRALIFFEDEQGQAQPIDPATLADILRPFDLKLVYLNACETAALSAFDVTQAFAPALMSIGTPAVIGMQIAVWDRIARQVAQDFYAALADNQPVDQALLSARQLARSKALSEAGIAIPVCYLRTASGQIVDLIKPGAPEALSRNLARMAQSRGCAQKTGARILGTNRPRQCRAGHLLGRCAVSFGCHSYANSPMSGSFNIAVAALSQLDSQGRAIKSNKGKELAQDVANQITARLKVSGMRGSGFSCTALTRLELSKEPPMMNEPKTLRTLPRDLALTCYSTVMLCWIRIAPA